MPCNVRDSEISVRHARKRRALGRLVLFVAFALLCSSGERISALEHPSDYSDFRSIGEYESLAAAIAAEK